MSSGSNRSKLHVRQPGGDTPVNAIRNIGH